MKKVILISFAILAMQAPSIAPAEPQYNVLLAGGDESNTIQIWLEPDGRNYVIDSVVPLEVGGGVCSNPVGNANELVCPAPPIAGFEMNASGGDDSVTVSKNVSIPVTMRGGSGADTLVGGSGPDKLLGGPGNDRLSGAAGDDILSGGPGDDNQVGGVGNDYIGGGPGSDIHSGGPGDDVILTGFGKDIVHTGTGNDYVRKLKPNPQGRRPAG